MSAKVIHKHVLARYIREGLNSKQIARKLGVSPTGVRAAMCRYGLTCWENGLLTQIEAAERLGVAVESVTRAIYLKRIPATWYKSRYMLSLAQLEMARAWFFPHPRESEYLHWLTTAGVAQRLHVTRQTLLEGMRLGLPRYAGLERVKVKPVGKGREAWRWKPEAVDAVVARCRPR